VRRCADWLDDDVLTKEAKEGVLHAIEFFAPAEGGAGYLACDGEHYTHASGALIEHYHFKITRQHQLIADGGTGHTPLRNLTIFLGPSPRAPFCSAR
jgi:hypothetical protein